MRNNKRQTFTVDGTPLVPLYKQNDQYISDEIFKMTKEFKKLFQLA